MIVRVKQSKLDAFRKKASNSEVEIIAFLVGKVTPFGVDIESFSYPKMVEATPISLEVDGEEYADFVLKTVKRGKTFLGTIHSHPNSPPLMSEADFSWHIADAFLISGIVEVTSAFTRVAFWSAHSALACDLEYL